MSRRLLLFACGVVAVIALLTTRQIPVEAAPASADLDQCRNGSQLAPVQCTGGAWVNGNAGASNAHWNEGESIAYRMRFANLTTGTADHFLTIEWDTTQGGKHALDYLTTFNRTETTANPCTDSKGTIAGCDPTQFTEFLIPQDTNTGLGTNAAAGRWNEKFRMYGGAIQEVVLNANNQPYTIASGSYLPAGGGASTGNSSTRITIRFRATRSNPILAWGGHIGTRADWTINESAIAINGSPYHMRLIELDGSGGNQDRSLSSDAAIFPAILTIIKDVRPATGTGDATSPQTFTFNATSQTIPGDGLEIPTPFTLTDDDPPPAGQTDSTPNSATFNLFLFGTANTKTVAETVPSGFDESLICTEASGGLGTTNNTTPKTSTANGSASIVAEEGELITCTFTNKIQNASIVLVKNVTRDNGGNATASSFPIHVKEGGSDITGSPFNVTDSQGNDATGTKTITVPGGTYVISENTADLNFPSGYTNTSIVCTGGGTGTGNATAVVAAGQTATCTVTNNDAVPKLTLDKIVTNNNGGQKGEGDWTIKAVKNNEATEKIEGVGASGSTDVVSGSSFKTGTYNLSETFTGSGGDPGYTTTGWECAQIISGQTPVYASATSVTVGLGQEWACRITNDDPKLTPTAETDQKVILHDSITLTNVVRGAGDAATGDNNKVTFKLYPTDQCTPGSEVYTEGPVPLNFASPQATTGTASTGTLAGKTGYLFDPATGQSQTGNFYWQVFYQGDTNNNNKTTACGNGLQGGEKSTVTLDPK